MAGVQIYSHVDKAVTTTKQATDWSEDETIIDIFSA